jgi:hypothetical protein
VIASTIRSRVDGSILRATVSTTDQHPRIAEFLRARDEARVFAGEQRLRHVHDNDRAIAIVAFAANQLDRLRQTDMP